MITENTTAWIENLAPRIKDYLIFNDRYEEVSEVSGLGTKALYYMGTGLLEDFFGSDYYNPDFEPGPEEGVKIRSVQDISNMVESPEDREKLENCIEEMLGRISGKTQHQEEEGGEHPDQDGSGIDRSNPMVNDFFNMMTDSIKMQGYYDGMESQIQEILNESGGSLDEEVEEHSRDQMSGNFDDLLADMLDGHIDTGEEEKDKDKDKKDE